MNIVDKISSFNRDRKWLIFNDEIKPSPTNTIIDVGFSDHEYSSVDNYLEKKYPYCEMITALGIDEPNEFIKHYPKIKPVRYEGRFFPFSDKVFDICWSNAVIEHVGNRERQVLFLKEIKRVSKIAFITTPNKLFPIEVHTRTPILHLFPKYIFEKYLRLIGKAWATEDYMFLLSKKDICDLLNEANIDEYRIISNKLFGLTLDFIIIF